MTHMYYCICGEELDDACPEHGDDYEAEHALDDDADNYAGNLED